MVTDHFDFSWVCRPPVDLDENGDFVFQQIDVESYNESNENGHDCVVFNLFGVTENGNSVLAHIHGFMPYLYIAAPLNTDENAIPHIEGLLHSKLKNDFPIFTELVSRTDIYGYNTSSSAFLRISTLTFDNLNEVKRLLSHERLLDTKNTNIYDTSLPHTVRFMVDAGIFGVNWIQLPGGKFFLRPKARRTSKCQIEVDIKFGEFISHPAIGEWSSIAPLRMMSFDIECAGRRGIFPDASHDPVIQIAAVLKVLGQDHPIANCVFSLRSCAHIPGASLFCFADERALLESFTAFVNCADPDVILGYNTSNFDFPYLLDRAKAIGASRFPFLGKLEKSITMARNSLFSSKAHGTRESKITNLEGRLQLDMLQVMQRDYKLRSYSLNSVCAHFLGEQKEDVPHTIITDLFNGNEDTRKRLAVYCLKDAVLPMRLMEKLMCMFNYVEMSRVTGVPFNYLLTRGQQIKVLSQLFRKAKQENYLIPDIKGEGSDEQYEGATVIEPFKGFYDIPIATLDFSSLYPSIMIAHNLCYTTMLDKHRIGEFSTDQVTCSPSGGNSNCMYFALDYFIKPSLRRGLLPIILEELISARKRAKADLKSEKDSFKKAVLDGRQLALKISANSVYGFTGATVGKLPCIAISQSVTAFGRQMIEKAQNVPNQIGSRRSLKAPLPNKMDSVMINFGLHDLEKVMELGKEAAALVTKNFERPMALEFEKVYFPYLLINKKRYAGLLWTKTSQYDKMDMKGIETVRRDNCMLVQTLIDTCLRKILIDRDIEAAKEYRTVGVLYRYAKRTIADLLQNKIDLSQLVITKALSKSGEEYAAKQAHVELAERMRKRDAGSAPALGDRVAYVIVKSSKGAAAYEKAEDPIYVLENNIPIDTQYYLENQLSKPLMRIFEPLLKHPNELLVGDHTRTVSIAAPSVGFMGKFTMKAESCAGCKAVLDADERAVCKYCRPMIREIYLKSIQTHIDAEGGFAKMWTQCQRCQGSLHQDILCTSRDCPIFYMRRKAQKELQDASVNLAKFDYAW